MSIPQHILKVNAYWQGGPFQKGDFRRVSTSECDTCGGTGLAPGDGATECGFCDEHIPHVIISSWGDPLCTN